MRRPKDLTTTYLVELALRERTALGEFTSVEMLIELTHRTLNQVTAALFHLRARRVADVVVEADGVGWWFARPAEEDDRLRAIVERTPEAKPRKRRVGRPRGKKAKP